MSSIFGYWLLLPSSNGFRIKAKDDGFSITDPISLEAI